VGVNDSARWDKQSELAVSNAHVVQHADAIAVGYRCNKRPRLQSSGAARAAVSAQLRRRRTTGQRSALCSGIVGAIAAVHAPVRTLTPKATRIKFCVKTLLFA